MSKGDKNTRIKNWAGYYNNFSEINWNPRPVKIVDYDYTYFEDLGDGNNWGIYRVVAKLSNGEEVNGYCQGNGDYGDWALETFEKCEEE